jgi:hypothetical protein
MKGDGHSMDILDIGGWRGGGDEVHHHLVVYTPPA